MWLTRFFCFAETRSHRGPELSIRCLGLSSDIIDSCLHAQLFLWILIAKVLKEKAELRTPEGSLLCLCLSGC